MKRVLEPEVMDTSAEADSYQAMNHSVANRAFVNRLQELGADGEMLDVGCGPGEITLLVARKFARANIIGVDLAEKMLVYARQALQKTDLASRCHFQIADAKDLKFANASFDCVFSNTILHHIPDPLPFVQEAWRVLRPGGLLLIRDLYRPATISEVNALVNKHASDEDEYSRALFHASLCAALTVEEMRELATQVSAELKVAVDSDRHMSLQGLKPAPI